MDATSSADAVNTPPPALPVPRLLVRSRYAVFRLFSFLLGLISRINLQGAENFPRSGPVILVYNHVNPLESPIWPLFGRADVWVVASAHLRKNLLRRWLYAAISNVIYIDRGEGPEALVARAAPVLAAGGMIAVSPEGRLSWTGILGAGKPGAATLASRTGTPIVPLVTWGVERLTAELRRGRRGHISVRVGQPLHFAADAADDATIDRRTEEIMFALARLLPERYRGTWQNSAGGLQ